MAAQNNTQEMVAAPLDIAAPVRRTLKRSSGAEAEADSAALGVSLPVRMLRKRNETFTQMLNRNDLSVAANKVRAESIKNAVADYRKLEACGMLKQWLNHVLLATSGQKQNWMHAQKRFAQESAEDREEEEKILAMRRAQFLCQLGALCKKH